MIGKKDLKQNILCRVFKNAVLLPKIGTALNINLSSIAICAITSSKLDSGRKTNKLIEMCRPTTPHLTNIVNTCKL